MKFGQTTLRFFSSLSEKYSDNMKLFDKYIFNDDVAFWSLRFSMEGGFMYVYPIRDILLQLRNKSTNSYNIIPNHDFTHAGFIQESNER